MKTEQPLGLFAVFALAGMLFGYAAGANDLGSIGLDDAFMTFAGALAGAWGAFLLESRRRKAETRSGQAAAGNRILFDLLMVWNDYTLFEQRHVSPLKGKDPDTHWCLMPATLFVEPRSGILDVSRLEFMLESPQAKLLPLIHIQHERYRQYADLAQRRSALLTDYVQLKWEERGILLAATNDVLIAAAGPALHGQVSSITKMMIEFLPQNLTDARGLFSELRAELKRLFPEHKFLTVAFDSTPEPRPVGAHLVTDTAMRDPREPRGSGNDAAH